MSRNELKSQLKVCKNAFLKQGEEPNYYQEIKSEIERLEALKEGG